MPLRAGVAAVAVLGIACSPPAQHPAPPIAVRIVATERGGAGGRLVVIDEAGDRQAELVPAAVTTARDNSAAFSPDGAWIAFASSRTRDLDRTSLWIVPAVIGAAPIRLTDDRADDLAPAWTPGSDALVFASDRGGTFDLWRVALIKADGRVRAGALTQLTHAPGAELGPSVARDGRIAYAALDRDDTGTLRSRIAVLDADGTARVITLGPGDSTPAWTPDGKAIAFAAPMARAGGAIDSDLLAVAPDGTDRRVLIDAPDTDESGPVWSADGRWLFATSLYRQVETGKPLLSSVVYVDLREQPPTLRMLQDRAGAISRLAPAIGPGGLDPQPLHAAPAYRAALVQILVHALSSPR
jgi:Tol biopolymer transport system component